MYCLSLTHREYTTAIIPWDEITEGVDILEVRIDLLEKYEEDFVQTQIAYIRSKTILPLLFTVRTASQGGSFPNQESQYFELLTLGLQLEVAYLDIEIGWNKKETGKIIRNKNTTHIIASFHELRRTYDTQGLRHVARRALYTKADSIKIVMMAETIEDNVRIFELISWVKKKYRKPITALCMGSLGITSRVLGEAMGAFLTLITHPSLSPAAPGQISLSEVESLRKKLGIEIFKT